MRLPHTLNIQMGKKLRDKTKEEIMKEVCGAFKNFGVEAIQICHEIIRVSFITKGGYDNARRMPGLHLFCMYCPIAGGGPPATMLHIFDYPHEEDNLEVRHVCADFGTVKGVKRQTYLSNSDIFTGTHLVTVILSSSPARFLSINGYNCRVWYKNQPTICDLCAVQGHKSADCPNKDKCRRCGASGHFARHCKGRRTDDENPQQASGDDPPSTIDLAAVADDALASHLREVEDADPLPFANVDEVPIGESLNLASVPGEVASQEPVLSHSATSESSMLSSRAFQEAGVSIVVTSEVGTSPPSGVPSSDATIVESDPPTPVESTDRVVAADSAVVENVENSGECPQVSLPPSSSADEDYLFTCGQQVHSQESCLSSPPGEQSPSVLQVSTDVDSMDCIEDSQDPAPDLASDYGARVFQGKAKGSRFGFSSKNKPGRHSNLPTVVADRLSVLGIEIVQKSYTRALRKGLGRR